ncbi:MAG: hypothetical protein Q7T20_13670 [Saprospiraceae bacterium]|nr:hypothetical protein [Saprospiraceae bacterium]
MNQLFKDGTSRPAFCLGTVILHFADVGLLDYWTLDYRTLDIERN